MTEGRPAAKEYPGERISVSFETRRCLHAAECVRGLPEVFDTAARPWVRPDGAAAEQVAEIVRRCPSGALQYRTADGDGSSEAPDRPTTVVHSPAGQLVVRGDLRVESAEGTRAETRAVLCGCAASDLQPYCDHSGPCGED